MDPVTLTALLAAIPMLVFLGVISPEVIQNAYASCPGDGYQWVMCLPQGLIDFVTGG